MFHAFAKTSDQLTAFFISGAKATSSISKPRLKDEPNARVRVLPRTVSWRLGSAIYCFLARREAGRGGHDIAFTRSPVFARSVMNAGLGCILELHAVPIRGVSDWRNIAKVWFHPHLRRIVTISQALADDLLAEFGQPHPGCDIVVAHDGAEAGARPGPRAAHGGTIRVGYFGHLYPGKGMEMIAELAPMLPDLHFDIHGGTEADLARWRTECASQGNITFHGYIPHARVAARMADCDILIAPYAARVSHVGGGDIGRWMSPLKLFEYMAAERPVVAADLPVLREVVRDGETALLCPAGDANAFAPALRRLAADPTLRARIGAAGRDLLEAEYTWDRRAARVLDGIVPVGGR